MSADAIIAAFVRLFLSISLLVQAKSGVAGITMEMDGAVDKEQQQEAGNMKEGMRRDQGKTKQEEKGRYRWTTVRFLVPYPLSLS